VKHTLDCLAFRKFAKNTLVGFARIRINELKLVIDDVSLHEKGEARWASLPAKPQVRDSALVADGNGKLAYVAVLEFETREARDAFSAAVWRVVADKRPEVAALAEATP
jgi:hypothetical protein